MNFSYQSYLTLYASRYLDSIIAYWSFLKHTITSFTLSLEDETFELKGMKKRIWMYKSPILKILNGRGFYIEAHKYWRFIDIQWD